MWTRHIALTALAIQAFRYMAKHPSKVIGPRDNPYLLRWHVVRVHKLPRVYVHRFIRSDDDRALHDHPWWFVSILLTGSYIEHTPHGPVQRTAPSVAHRNVKHRHRIELMPGRPVRTLFITGPVVRRWGFWCPDHLDGDRFIPWREFDGCD